MHSGWLLVGCLFGLVACESKHSTPPSMQAQEPPSQQPTPQRPLTAEQHRVLREAGTERPFADSYRQFKALPPGDFLCVGCGHKLFSSNTSFDSGCGWPAFYDVANAASVTTRRDTSHGMIRTEVLCGQCGGHLGHLFEGEGLPTPTDKRYCINACVLDHSPKNTQ